MATKRCPFCGNSAVAKTVGDAYNLDCGFCDIRIEISKAAYAAPCANPEALLAEIQERIARGAERPRIDRAAMQKTATEAKGI